LHKILGGEPFTCDFKYDLKKSSFETLLDCEWFEFFLKKSKENNSSDKLEQNYLSFFGFILDNNGLIDLPFKGINWSTSFNFYISNDNPDGNPEGNSEGNLEGNSEDNPKGNPKDNPKDKSKDIFEIVYYTLNYLYFIQNSNDICKSVGDDIYKIISNPPSYKNLLLFYSITKYLQKEKGVDDGSFFQWLRITKNLILNTQFDKKDKNPKGTEVSPKEEYRKGIEAIDSLLEHRNGLLEFLSQKKSYSFFNEDQVKEEHIKAKIILDAQKNESGYNSFDNLIYKAEKHPYFSGQIRSALYLSEQGSKYDKDTFDKYWQAISSLFDDTKPKNGTLLRKALLTFGDYTREIGSDDIDGKKKTGGKKKIEYITKTLYIDDPNEASGIPSIKRLFSRDGVKPLSEDDIVKSFLVYIVSNKDIDIEKQLNNIVAQSQVPKDDWRYCFITDPDIFILMSDSYYKIISYTDEIFLIPKKNATGYIFEIFTAKLKVVLDPVLDPMNETKKNQEKSIDFGGDKGLFGDHYLRFLDYHVRFAKKQFKVCKKDNDKEVIFSTSSNDPIEEAKKYLFDVKKDAFNKL
jgi:hypothetical protein